MNQRNLAYFQNLYLIATADHQLANQEKQLLANISQKLSIRAREAAEIMCNIRNLDFVVPDNRMERLEQLEEIVKMMMIDRQIHDTEYHLCLAYTEKIGYSRVTLDGIIRKLI